MEVNSTLHHTTRSTEGLSVEAEVLRPTNFALPGRHTHLAYRQTPCVGTAFFGLIAATMLHKLAAYTHVLAALCCTSH